MMTGMRRARLLAGIIAGLGLLALAGSHARADVLPSFSSVTGSNGNYTWTYAPTNDHDSTVVSGDYFELVDFNGFNGQHSQPTGWTFLSSLSGPTPSNELYKDNPSVSNLVWEYTGSTPITGQAALGTFTAGSSLGSQALGMFVSETTSTAGLAQNVKLQNMGFVSMPTAPSVAALPEATPLWVLTVGLPLLLLTGFLKSPKRAALKVV